MIAVFGLEYLLRREFQFEAERQNDRPNALLSRHASHKPFPVGLNLNASCTASPEALCFQVVHRILVHVVNHDSRMNRSEFGDIAKHVSYVEYKNILHKCLME